MLEHLNADPSPPERTVVLGAGGFVGGAIVRRLAVAGAHVLALTRDEIDLLAPDAGRCLAALLRPTDAVVAAAAMAPCKSIGMLIDNMVMTRAMTEAFATAPIAHLVNISSDAVYADGPVPLTEKTPTAPTSPHGVMHLAREIALAGATKAPFATLRPTLIYGAADPHNGYGPNRFQRLSQAGDDIVLFGEGEERRDHVFVDDVAEIVWHVLTHRSAGVLNIATGETHSFRDIAHRIVTAGPRKVAVKSSTRSGPMPHNGYRPFDTTGCRSAFPGFSYTPLAEGLSRLSGEPVGAR
jgi:nucleoside-diphosphate-sugar epimerase